MEIGDVKQQIKTGGILPLYIFYGDEGTIIKEYIKQIAKKSGSTIIYDNSISDLVHYSKSTALIQEKYVHVLLDDKEFLTNEKAWGFTGIKGDIVIFQYTNCDKRLKFWKNFANTCVEFKKLDNEILIKYIQKKIDLSRENCLKLIDCCEGAYGRILLEIDKIVSYINAVAGPNDDVDVDKVFEYLLEQGVIYQAPKDAIFDFVKAFLDRDTILAQELLKQSYAVGEATLVLISVLYDNVKTLLQVKSGEKNLGINGWQAKNVSAYKDRYTNGELVNCMRLLRKCEKGIKTGTMPENIAMQYVIVNVM